MGPSLLAYGMNKFCAAAFLAAGLTVSSIPLRASSEGSVPSQIQSMVIKTTEAGWAFTLTLNEEGALDEIEANWGGKSMSFNSKHFGQVPRAAIQHYRISVLTKFGQGKHDHVILIIPYNERDIDVDGGKSYYTAYDAVRIHFSNKGQIPIWQRAEAVEQKPGLWKLTSKGEILSEVVDGVDRVDANGVYDNGTHKGKKNPYIYWLGPDE